MKRRVFFQLGIFYVLVSIILSIGVQLACQISVPPSHMSLVPEQTSYSAWTRLRIWYLLDRPPLWSDGVAITSRVIKITTFLDKPDYLWIDRSDHMSTLRVRLGYGRPFPATTVTAEMPRPGGSVSPFIYDELLKSATGYNKRLTLLWHGCEAVIVPNAILWKGFISNVICWLVLISSLHQFYRFGKYKYRLCRGRCACCGYELCNSLLCPECGSNADLTKS